MQDHTHPAPADGQHSAIPPTYDSTTPHPAHSCAVCGYPLDVHTETAYGHLITRAYTHTPAVLAQQPDDHTPVPVPTDEIRTNFLCDFCLTPSARWRLPTEDFEASPGVRDVDGWAACDACAQNLRDDDWTQLIERAYQAQRDARPRPTRSMFRALYTEVLKPHITGPVTLHVPNTTPAPSK
jgi:hypothetical protein